MTKLTNKDRLKIIEQLAAAEHPNIGKAATPAEGPDPTQEHYYTLWLGIGGGNAIINANTGKIDQWKYRHVVTQPANTRQKKRVDDWLISQTVKPSEL